MTYINKRHGLYSRLWVLLFGESQQHYIINLCKLQTSLVHLQDTRPSLQEQHLPIHLSPMAMDPGSKQDGVVNMTIIKVEALVVAAGVLLLLQLVLGSCRRRWHNSFLKYGLQVCNGIMFPLNVYTLGTMQSSPIKNSSYPVWAGLVFSSWLQGARLSYSGNIWFLWQLLQEDHAGFWWDFPGYILRN